MAQVLKALYIWLLLWCLFGTAVASEDVLEFPALSTNYPLYAQLYSDVQVGNTEATGAPNTSTEGWETLNAVYAYLHPQSPVQYNTNYLARLKVLMNVRFTQWRNSDATHPNYRDIAGGFHANYAYALMSRYRPEDISDVKALWEEGIKMFCEKNIAENTLLYNDHILASLWLNGDITHAMGIYFAGVALSNSVWQTQAQDLIDQVMTQAVIGDGATHYVGFNTENSTYRNASIEYMLWWWKLTGSAAMKTALDQTIPYVPLSVEPAGFQEQSSGTAYKHMYNGLRGRSVALATAYLYGDRYNYYFGAPLEASPDTLHFSAGGILWASLYRGSMSPLTPPSDFIVHDRAIMGPRGRWPGWAFVATGRDPQSPTPEHPDEGYDGRMIGKNTFVGALALGDWTNNTPLQAALDGVCPEVKIKTGVSTDWARSYYDDGIYRFLAQDEQTSTITRDTFGSLSTHYRLSERVSAGATTNWGSGTVWLGDQLWLLTKDRVVGLVQVHNDQPADVYGLDIRLVLTGGRKGILGAYHDLAAVSSNEYRFGELKLRIGENNLNGISTVQRVGMQNQVGDDYGAVLRLHDAQDTGDDLLIRYPSGTRRWAVVECVRSGHDFSESINNVQETSATVAVLEVREADRHFRLVQNLTSSARTYTGNFWGIRDGTSTLHKSWTNSVGDITAQPGNAIAINEDLPPYGHVVVVSSTNVPDHTGHESFYEDIFTETAHPARAHYLDWIYSYPSVGGAVGLADDPDQDGINNAEEYALGGDPGLAETWTLQHPVLQINGTTAEYSYPRRKNPVEYGLSYRVETTSDLVSNVWETNGSPEALKTINGDFDSVTKLVPTVGSTNAFFRLRIDVEL